VRDRKLFVWQTMDQHASHVAMALVCFLYGYAPGDLAQLTSAFLNQNIQRIRRQLVHQLHARKPGVNLFQGDDDTRRTRLPTAHERWLVRHALAVFTPSGSVHIPAQAADRSILDTHFVIRAIHESTHTVQKGSDMPLNDPMHHESIPPNGGDSLPAPGDRFHPASLSPTTLAFLQQSLARNQHRRHVYRARCLRVCLDDEARWQYDPGVSVCEPFRVPLSTSYLEIFGDDADGALLLAVFPLPAPAEVEDDGAQHLAIILEGGQMVALEIALGDETDGEERTYVIQLAYAESAAADMQGVLGRPTSRSPDDQGEAEHRASTARVNARNMSQPC
jgi:hypothetical protein